jgi:hypothetical protein
LGPKLDINKFHTTITDMAELISKDKYISDKVPEYLGKFGNQTLNELVGQILHSKFDETL